MKKYLNQVHKRSCPICNCDESDLIYTQHFSKGFRGLLLTGYTVVACKRCGFTFADDIPSQQEFDEYYEALSKYEQSMKGLQISQTEKVRFHDIASIISKWCPQKEIKILDIGCANGDLLNELKSFGFTNLTGLDPSPQCSRNALDNHGLDVMIGSISTLPQIAKTKYDLIIMVGVVEHIKDLSASISLIQGTLESNGEIFIEVPDVIGFSQYMDAPYQQFSTEHINFFSQTSIRNLMISQNMIELKTQRSFRKVSAKSIMPVVTSLYQVSSNSNSELIYDDKSALSIYDYVSSSAKIEDKIQNRLLEYSIFHEPVLIWGTGTQTLHLIAQGSFDALNIVGFVDSNPKYQGLRIMGKPVFSPSQIKSRSEAILISTQNYELEIEHQIRNDLKMSNKIMMLYK